MCIYCNYLFSSCLLSFVIYLFIYCRGVSLNFFGYTPRLAQFAATVSRDVGDLSFWSAVPPSVIDNCKDRLLRTFRSCE